MRYVLLSAVLSLVALPATAEWLYTPHYPPAGRAIGPGSYGPSMLAECIGGQPRFALTGDFTAPATIEAFPIDTGPHVTFVLSVDRGERMAIPARCDGRRCDLMLQSAEQFRCLRNGLNWGRRLDIEVVGLGGVGYVSLQQSRYALLAVAARGCPRLLVSRAAAMVGD